MATVNAEVRFAPQLTAWFTANPTKVLQDGEIVYCSDGANIGKYVIGDNSTQLSALTYYGGSGALTIGTTTITGGTDTRILYNNAGVVGEYLVTGTGTTAVLSTSPTFTTDITTPLIIGGSAVGSTIQYKGTSGVGTSTVAAHQFLVGNNGAITAIEVFNTGNIHIYDRLKVGGTSTISGSYGLDVKVVNTNITGSLYFGGGDARITSGIPTTGYGQSFYGYNGVSEFNAFNIATSNSSFNTTSGAITNFTFNTGTHTNQTLSTNIPNFKVTGSTKQWATGALATQYFNYFSANTVAFAGASTATNVYGLYVEAATAGANATITNNYAAGFGGNVNIIGTPHVSGVAGVDGTFTTVDGKTVTVSKGLITSIV